MISVPLGERQGLEGVFDTVTIDRENKQLVIKRWNPEIEQGIINGLTNVDTMTWDLDGWTGRYGKPIELSLALHLSTMAPDFTYDFCMDKDLQTVVHMDLNKITYDAEYVYITNEGETITKEEIDELFDKLEPIQDIINSIDSSHSTDKIELDTISEDDEEDDNENSRYIYPTSILTNTNVISINSNKKYRMADENRNNITIYSSNGSANIPNYNVSFNDKGEPIFKYDANNTNIESTQNHSKYNIKESDDEFEIECLCLNEIINILNSSIPECNGEMKNWAIKYLKVMDSEVVENVIDFMIDNMDDTSEYNRGDKSYHKQITELYDEYKVSGTNYHTNEEYKELASKLSILQENIVHDIELIEKSYKEDMEKWGIDFEILEIIHKALQGTNDSIKTYQPYITHVDHHWYRDIYFDTSKYDGNSEMIKDIDDFDVYDINEGSVDSQSFRPTGISEQELSILLDKGFFKVKLTPSEGGTIEQTEQPIKVTDEPWHWKVKNWMLYGYYFIYDGTEKTANEIKKAREYLKDSYDSEDPLLGFDGSKEDSIDVDAINNKAKEINEELRRAGINAKLQRISFDKNASLAAFSILKNVHTYDAEYVYRELKQLLIELDYFSAGDFEVIETNVLDWLIPEYKPYDWPNPKYEIKDTEYGVYILSKEGFKTEIEANKDRTDSEDETDNDSSNSEDDDSSNSDTTSTSHEGFDEGLDVVAPGTGIIKEKNEHKIIIEFTSPEIVKGMIMQIEGFDVDTSILDSSSEEIEKGQKIGTTTTLNIRILMKDEKKAIINNVKDYLNVPKQTKNNSKNGGGEGAIPLWRTSLSKQEFVDGANNYSGISGTEFEGKMGEFYDVCTAYEVNPVFAFVRAIWESGLRNSYHNFWGINAPNGSSSPQVADSMIGTLEVFCKLISEDYQDETSMQYKMIMERYEERRSCTENGGISEQGYGTPDTVEGIMSIYSWLGDHYGTDAGTGGYYYLDPGIAGVTTIYSTHEEFVELCQKKHTAGSPTTVYEQGQYTAFQVQKMVETARILWGDKGLK